MDVITKDINVNDQLYGIFEDNYDVLISSSSDIVNRYRQQAIEIFRKTGIPVHRSEDYKYTNLEPFFKKGFKTRFAPDNIKLGVEEIFRCDIPSLDTHVILLVNGFYFSEGEPLNELPGGIVAGSLQKAARDYPELFKKYYGKAADMEKDGLVALNTAFAQDGLFIYVPDNVIPDKPIQIINIALADEDRLIQHRNLFITGKNAHSRLIICDHSLSAQDFLTNSVTEIFAEENAHIDIANIQNEHNGCVQLSNTFIRQQKYSNVTRNTISLHGGLIRNNLKVELLDEQAHNNAFGLYVADGGQHVDSFTVIEHHAPRCTSNQLYKGVLDDFSTGAFNGRIHVMQDAQKTVAFQKNSNLLLTKDAKMHTKPQLEIYADDVKCSHGATVGQLDENALFYMRSRGISQKEAKLLMMYAYAHEVIGKITVEPLLDRIDELVNKRFRGELSRCNNCAMHCG